MDFEIYEDWRQIERKGREEGKLDVEAREKWKR